MRAFKHGPCATVMFKMKIDFPRKALQESEQDFAQRFRIGKLTKEGEHVHYITLHIMHVSPKERYWPSAKTVEKI